MDQLKSAFADEIFKLFHDLARSRYSRAIKVPACRAYSIEHSKQIVRRDRDRSRDRGKIDILEIRGFGSDREKQTKVFPQRQRQRAICQKELAKLRRRDEPYTEQWN